MMNEERFDQLLDSLRDEGDGVVGTAPAPEVKARVWEKLSVSAGTVGVGCAPYRADLPGYAAGTLLESRRLLVEDHLSRCVECRKVLAAQQRAGQVVEMPRLRAAGRFSGWSKWAIAAGVAAMTIYAGRERIDSLMAPGGARATVEMVSGELRGADGAVLAKGASLGEGDVVRTGPGSRAVLRLVDGSAVEVNQLASLAVHAAWSGQTVRLDSGDVILQAAKQRRGHLRVRTRDSVASVKGTIFAVSTGVAGSLVAVAEGAVEVEQGSSQELVKPGQRKASSAALEGVTPQDAFAWSQNAQEYLALLADFSKIEKAVAGGPENARREARLLPSLPAQPVVYGAVPNIGSSLSRAVEDQMRVSAPLRTWLESAQGKEFRKLLDAMNTVTPHLGDEIVFVLAGQTKQVPLLMAEVKAGQRATLEQAIAKLMASGPAAAYRVTDRLLLMSETTASLAALQATMGQGAATPFAQEIARRYQRGAGWLLAVNMESLMPVQQEAAVLGVDKVRHLFFEQSSASGIDRNEAGVTFSAARTGVASWLGLPAPAASSEYVSSDAVFALSAVTKNPRAAWDELVTMISRVQPEFVTELRKFETQTGIRLADDVAAALGSDFTFAIETPTLPMPGWTMTVAVTRASAIDSTMRRMVDLFNTKVTNPADRITLTVENANGRAWNVLKTKAGSLQWTYDGGYLVASMDRAVALRALATRNGGFPLVRSAKFRERLPVTGSVHQSGFLWLSVSESLAPLFTAMPALKGFAENRGPVLMTVNGESERIVAASRTRLTAFLVDLAMMASPSERAARVKAKAKANNADEDEADEE